MGIWTSNRSSIWQSIYLKCNTCIITLSPEPGDKLQKRYKSILRKDESVSQWASKPRLDVHISFHLIWSFKNSLCQKVFSITLESRAGHIFGARFVFEDGFIWNPTILKGLHIRHAAFRQTRILCFNNIIHELIGKCLL